MDKRAPAVGVHPVATDVSMPISDLAVEVEARGLRSLYLPEHTHRPVSDNDLPGRYQRTIDPFIGSAFAAAVTTSLEVGTGVCLPAHHDAIALAKAIATLEHLSAGRLVVGVGLGSGRAESANHGVAGGERGAVLDETMLLVRNLWTEEVACFDGQHRRLSPSRSWPKPDRIGHPPVLFGGRAGPRTFERIVTWADGWLPTGPEIGTPEFSAALTELRSRWSSARRPDGPQVCFFFPVGSFGFICRQLERAAELGVQRVQMMVEDRGREDVLPLLDRLAAAEQRFRGQ